MSLKTRLANLEESSGTTDSEIIANALTSQGFDPQRPLASLSDSELRKAVSGRRGKNYTAILRRADESARSIPDDVFDRLRAKFERGGARAMRDSELVVLLAASHEEGNP